MNVVTGHAQLETLSQAECEHLLRSREVGRVAVNRRGQGPLVVPVNYTIDDTGAVVFRTEVGTKLAAITRGAVSFEVDHIVAGQHAGWSVLVVGLAHEIDVSTGAASTVEPWVRGPMARAVRIVPTTVTGRVLRPRQGQVTPRTSPRRARRTRR